MQNAAESYENPLFPEEEPTRPARDARAAHPETERSVSQPELGADLIWRTLVENGVEVVFGYPGGCIMPAYDALPRHAIRHVLVRHEQGAAHMADGYARASGRVGVAIATSGPGATNLVTGIATAKMDSVPIVCITGQVPSTLIGTDAFQETDITGVTLPITKHNFLVTRAADIAPALRSALRIAQSGRPGPVLVDITKDAQLAPVTNLTGESSEPAERSSRLEWHREADPSDEAPGLDLGAIERAVEMMARSERPLIFAGHGVILSGASRVLRELVDRTGIPVASTLLGLGAFPASHPLHLGMMGMHGEAWVNHAIQRADLLIALGMRFDDRVTGKLATYAPCARKIHVELDAAEIDKNVKVDVPILGDVADALRAMLALPVRRPAIGDWLEHIRARKAEAAARDVQSMPDRGRLLAAHVIRDLWRITGGDAIVVTDVGQHQMWEAQYYHHELPRSLITSGGLGTMGFALPAAIGTRLARPDAEVWVIAGDGGFQMTAAELSTIAQEELKLNIAIINNGYLGMVRQWQEMFYQRRYVATPIRSPDFVKLAEAHGLQGIRVTKRAEVEPAVRHARSAPGTVVLEFQVEGEDSVYPMVPTGADLDDMIRRPWPK
jgi:acetolactate synthase-1/2/3 large subunit